LAFADAVSRFDEERLATALPQLFTLYLEAGALDEFTARLHDLAEEVSARGSTHRRLWVEVMLQLGRAHMSHGEFGAARVELEPVAQQLRLAAGPDADATLARVLDWLGSCARIMGDREAAEDHVTEALRLADGLPGRLADEALALQSDLTYNLASLRQVQGRSEEALQLHERSLDLCLRAGADVSAALRRLSIAHIKIVSGAGLDEAQRHLDEALAVGRAARASRVEGGALNALAVLSGAQGDQAGAERFHLESLALARQQGQQDDQRAALANLGGILNGQARLDEAAVYLRRALELAQRTGNPGGLNQAYTLVAENCSLRGDHGAAAAHLRAALDPEVLAGTPAVGQAQCLSLLANVHERAGRSDRARELRLHLLAHPATPPGLKRKIEGTLGASERGHAADGASEHGPATDRASKHGPAADRASAPSETRSLLELAAEHRAVLGRTPAWTSGGTPERTPGGT
jgi:tetratricopeptide (TPR) repeat protein